MKLKAKITQAARGLLPPNRVWAAAQIALILAASVHLALHLRLDDVTREAQAQAGQFGSRPSRPIDDIAGDDAQLLSTLCVSATDDSLELLGFVGMATTVFDEAGLIVESSHVTEVSEDPPRRRLRWILSGTAESLVRSVSDVLRLRYPIAVHQFRWHAGADSESRSLDLTIDFHSGTTR